MKIISPGFEILFGIPDDILQRLELAGRVCYKSEDRITEDSAHRFVKMIVKNHHLSVLEHVSISVRIICDRATTHQLVRHRIASYSQESQRYVKYKDDLSVVVPQKIKVNEKAFEIFKETIEKIETNYKELVDSGINPEDARALLPNACKTAAR